MNTAFIAVCVSLFFYVFYSLIALWKDFAKIKATNDQDRIHVGYQVLIVIVDSDSAIQAIYS